MFGFYAALSPIYGEQPHYIGSALPKNQTYYCKFNNQRATRPIVLRNTPFTSYYDCHLKIYDLITGMRSLILVSRLTEDTLCLLNFTFIKHTAVACNTKC